jgi:putative endonuclease
MTVKEYIAVYILASRRNGTLYVGVTSNLIKRIHEHRTHAVQGFTAEHNVAQLVYFEPHETMDAAIHREKRLKKYTRQQKLRLIETENPHWRDLWEDITV